MKSDANVVRILVRVASAGLVMATACGDNRGGTDEATERATEPLDLGSLNVLTRSYDNQRSGANPSETVLTQANVNPSQFGKVLQLPVDDEVYAQLLYASGVSIGGVNHHVVYVATANNSVYAFDADSGGAPLWMKNYNGSGNPPNHTQVGVGGFCGGSYNDFSGNIGIVGTPVIDGNAGKMYFVTRHVVGTTFSQILRAIDVTTGNDVVAAKTIAATVPGSGDGSSGGVVAFDPRMHNQRSALALAGGAVYIAWASHCDLRPYHGWVMAYDATSLNQTGVFNATPNGTQAGIWMSGDGPIVDSTSVYYNTGNGSGDLGGTQPGLGESVLKLSFGTLNLGSSFTASTWSSLNAADNDLGVSGMAAVPGTSFILTGSKTGTAYLLDSSNLGGLNSGDTQIPQFFQAADTSARPSATHHIHSGPLMWSGPQGLNTYFWSENDFLRAYRFNTVTLKYDTPAALVGSILPPLGMPGGFMTVSSNGAAPGTGILWATTPTSGDANHGTVAGTLRAFNAETLAVLWDSSSAVNTLGSLAKFNPPLVANGSVYVASFENAAPSLSKEVSVYRNISTTQAPLGGTAWTIPGTIEAEKYDTGGANVAYFDTTPGNSGAQIGPPFRTNDVDIGVTTDTGGGFNVGWIAAGEWLKYTVNVKTAGVYTLNLRLAATTAGNKLHVEMDGANISGTVSVPNTGGWQNWTTVAVTTASLSAGQHVLRAFFDTGGFNLNWMSFANFTSSGEAPFGGTPWPIPGKIEAENYDTGGQNVAYFDTTPGNTGAQYRHDDVDIEKTLDTGGGFDVGWTAAGEWLKYTVNVQASGTQTLSLRLAAVAAGHTMHVEMDGANISGTVSIPNTGGWQNWVTASVTVPSLSAGQHVLRVVFDTGGCNLNWLGF